MIAASILWTQLACLLSSKETYNVSPLKLEEQGPLLIGNMSATKIGSWQDEATTTRNFVHKLDRASSSTSSLAFKQRKPAFKTNVPTWPQMGTCVDMLKGQFG